MSAEQPGEKPQPLPGTGELVGLQEDILDRWAQLPAAQQAVVALDLLQQGVSGPYGPWLAQALEARRSSWLEASEGGQESDARFRPFQVASLCRADLEERFGRDEIALLDDEDMKRLADRMGDAYLDQGFWADMEIAGQRILEEKGGSSQQDSPDQ